jgi:hypothetical protein
MASWWQDGGVRRVQGLPMCCIEFWHRPYAHNLSYKNLMRAGSVQTLIAYDGEARWGRPSASLFHHLRRRHMVAKKGAV